jgi:hypothetical protein
MGSIIKNIATRFFINHSFLTVNNRVDKKVYKWFV